MIALFKQPIHHHPDGRHFQQKLFSLDLSVLGLFFPERE
jgi:hypothetical protein